MLAWTLTNRYRFWRNGTKLGQMSFRPVGNVIVISLDIWCQALISTKRQKSTNALLMCTVHWHFQQLVQPLVCQQFYLLNHARFRHFFCDFPAFVPRIFSNFCHDMTVIFFKIGAAIFGKFYRDEQTSPMWAVGQLEQGFAIYQPINSLIIRHNNSRTLPYHTYSYSIWYKS